MRQGDQPFEVHSVSELVSFLLEKSPKRVAIDGFPGLGKTTIAEALAPQLDFRIVHLDDFLECNQGEYLECLDYNQLALELQKVPLIVEGVCMLAALERAGVDYDVLVYLKPWQSYWAEIAHGCVLGEAAIYVHQYRPDSVADIVYGLSDPSTREPLAVTGS